MHHWCTVAQLPSTRPHGHDLGELEIASLADHGSNLFGSSLDSRLMYQGQQWAWCQMAQSRSALLG